jgi:hypothetical protein
MDYKPLFPQRTLKTTEKPKSSSIDILNQYSTSVSLSNVNIFLVAYENGKL